MKLALLLDVTDREDAERLGADMIHFLFLPEVRKKLCDRKIGFAMLPDDLFRDTLKSFPPPTKKETT